MGFETISELLQNNLLEYGFEVYPFLVNNFAPIYQSRTYFFRSHGIILLLIHHSVFQLMMMIQSLLLLLVNQLFFKKTF
jgi:hypothetical protein